MVFLWHIWVVWDRLLPCSPDWSQSWALPASVYQGLEWHTYSTTLILYNRIWFSICLPQHNVSCCKARNRNPFSPCWLALNTVAKHKGQILTASFDSVGLGFRQAFDWSSQQAFGLWANRITVSLICTNEHNKTNLMRLQRLHEIMKTLQAAPGTR